MDGNGIYNIRKICKELLAYAVYITGIYFVVRKVVSLLFREKGLYIFLYHRIGLKDDWYYKHNLTVKMNNFLKQLEFFNKSFHCVSMTEAVDMLKKKNAFQKDLAVLTFDDGYEDNFVKGLELFKRFKLRPVIYLVAGAVDNNAALWTETIDGYMLSDACRKIFINYFGFAIKGEIDTSKGIFECSEKIKDHLKGMKFKEIKEHLEYLKRIIPINSSCIKSELMNWEEAITLASDGCELGSHTMNHVNLTAEDKDEAVKEIAEAGTLINERTGMPVLHFAYPYGKIRHFSSEIIEIVKRYYQSAVTAVEGINAPGDNAYTLKRIIVSSDIDIIAFKVRLLYIKLKCLIG